jgi:peptide-methionine (S)-S-oxide reductase
MIGKKFANCRRFEVHLNLREKGFFIMSIYLFRFLLVISLFAIAFISACSGIDAIETTSAQSSDEKFLVTKNVESLTIPKAKKGEAVAVFAGGCFWGVEAVFEHIKGVRVATSGYSGGKAENANYKIVSNGDTDHAEAVHVIYDPKKVSYQQLLKVFFSVAHNPTELNRQGPDTGTQYRSAIFYNDDEQKRLAESYIKELTEAKTFDQPIVTQVVPLVTFYKAEDYHQDYLVNHPNQPYIVTHDKPKVENLSKQFPDLYKK